MSNENNDDICEICEIKNTEHTPVYIESIRKPCIEIWNKKITLSSRFIHFYVCKKCNDFLIETCQKEKIELKKMFDHEKQYRRSKSKLFY